MFQYQSPGTPPRYVEPAHVFEDATGRRRAIARFMALIVVIGLALFVGDFVLRLYHLPLLNDRDVSVSGEYESGMAVTGPEPLAQPYVQVAHFTANCSAPETETLSSFGVAILPLNDGTAWAAVADRCDSLDQLLVNAHVRADEVVAAVTDLRSIEEGPAGRRLAAQFHEGAPQTERSVRTERTTTAELSLTFDGLPAQQDLPELLALLEQYGLEATFFVDSSAVLAHGEVLQRLTANGHIIGMLYSEPEPSLTSVIIGPKLVDNATQQMIVRETGMRTLLVRASADRTSLPESRESLAALEAQRAAGYLPVFTGIVAPFGTLESQSFMAKLENTTAAEESYVLRFDLSAGKGSQVMSTLPSILSELAADGFGFRPLRVALDLAPGEAMPVSAVASPKRDAVVFGFFRFMQFGLTVAFLVLMAVAALRALIFLALAFWRGRRTSFDRSYQPPVTIIVPAYNEEAVIERCINSLLEQDHPNVEIVVVDDGSTDRTARVVLDKFGDHPRVRLIQQENRGKWFASNYALSLVTTPFFVIADADSLFLPDTVSWLIQQFKDESVGGVAGLVEVGNHENILSHCQRIEYIVSQNVMRRAYEAFEGILVVPGAVGAWRTEAVHRAHDFSGATITEDADLTVAVHRAGYRVRFQEQARSVTEAPATVRAFLRQRLRWTFGMLQVAWKHRRAIGEGRTVGVISIIDSIVFGLISSVISPLVDVLLVLLLLQGVFMLATGAEISMAGFPTMVLLSYLALTLIDVMNTLAAFWFERRFSLKLLILVPFLRFGYRQLLYISTLRALWHAITGHMAGWNKLDRTGAAFAGSFRGAWPKQQQVRGGIRELVPAQ